MISDKIYEWTVWVGEGRMTLAVRLACMSVIMTFVMGIYAFSQFTGLRNAEAMDQAQIAKCIARGEGFGTKYIRPADLFLLSKKTPSLCADASRLRDLRNAPLYPYLLAKAFAIAGAGKNEISPGILERRVIIPFGVISLVIAGIFLFLSTRLIFDDSAALTAVTVFFVSSLVAGASISGTSVPLTMMLCMIVVYSALVSVRNINYGESAIRCFIPLIICGAGCGFAVLSSYAMIILPVLVVLYGVSQLAKMRVLWVVVIMLLAGVVTAPWLVRNATLTGNITGSAFQSVLNNTSLGGDCFFDGSLSPDSSGYTIFRTIKSKLINSFSSGALGNIRLAGEGIVICLFLASLLYWHDRPEQDILKWCVFLVFAVAYAVDVLWYNGVANTMVVFYPLVVMMASGYLFILLSKSEFADAGMRMISILLLIGIVALPLLLQVAAIRAPAQYPPYYTPFITYACGMLEKGEYIATDMPWATAWYGDKVSAALPDTPDKIAELNAKLGGGLKAIYLTTITSDRHLMSELVDGKHKGWLPILSGNVPSDFNFSHAISFPPGKSHQIFLTDKQRWQNNSPARDKIDASAGADNRPTTKQ